MKKIIQNFLKYLFIALLTQVPAFSKNINNNEMGRMLGVCLIQVSFFGVIAAKIGNEDATNNVKMVIPGIVELGKKYSNDDFIDAGNKESKRLKQIGTDEFIKEFLPKQMNACLSIFKSAKSGSLVDDPSWNRIKSLSR